MATQIFITNDKVNVSGLVLAGSADFKNVLMEAERFDPRLAAKARCSYCMNCIYNLAF
jgi:peptide chain release factor subunit 1